MAAEVAIDAAPVSYEEYVAGPETTQPVEVVDGQVIVNASPAPAHQRAVVRLARVLGDAAMEADRWPDAEVLVSPADWVLRRVPLLVRQPDLVVTATRVVGARLESPPLLAVEVVSPDSRERDLVTKRREYAAAGLAWYWLVSLDPAQIVVLRNDGGVFVDHGSASGDERLEVTDPFAVALAPSDSVV